MKIEEEGKEENQDLKNSLGQLFSAKYDLIVQPSDEGKPTNLSLIIRVLINTCQDILKKLEELDDSKRKKVCV